MTPAECHAAMAEIRRPMAPLAKTISASNVDALMQSILEMHRRLTLLERVCDHIAKQDRAAQPIDLAAFKRDRDESMVVLT
jgi:hypothetical protein